MTAAAIVRTVVIAAISVSGIAKRTCARARRRRPWCARRDPRSGPLDGRERKGQDAPHEVLAQLGEDLLREHERRSASRPRERRLGDHERRRGSSTTRSMWARVRLLGGRRRSARPGSAARRGRRPRRARAATITTASAPRWRPEQPAGVAPDLRPGAIGSRSLTRPLLAGRCRGTRRLVRRSSRCAPRRRRGLPRGRRPGRPGRGRAGCRSRPASCGCAGVAQPACDARLGVRVDRARRLHEDEDLGVGEECAREHEPLPLPAREPAAALVDRRVEAVRERSRTSCASATATAARTRRRRAARRVELASGACPRRAAGRSR